MKIQVYSDGSSDGKSGGTGGWAFLILVDGIKVHEDSGSEQNATNNVVEVLGASKGLEWVAINYPKCEDVTLISDSQCVLRWATGEYNVKKPHLIPYVIQLRKFFRQVKAKTRWERGHVGEPNNCRCDELAKAARENVGINMKNRLPTLVETQSIRQKMEKLACDVVIIHQELNCQRTDQEWKEFMLAMINIILILNKHMKKFFGLITLISWSLLAYICFAFPDTVPTGIYEALFSTLLVVGMASPLLWCLCRKPDGEGAITLFFTVISLIVGLLIVVALMIGVFYVIASTVGFAVGLLPDWVTIAVFVVWVLPMILKEMGKHIGKGIAESTKDKE